MTKIIRGIVLGLGVLSVLCVSLSFMPLHAAPKKCTGTCKRTFYYKIKKITPTSISDSKGQAVGQDDKNYDNLVNEISNRNMGGDLKTDLENTGQVIDACKKGCTCKMDKPKWTPADKRGANSGTDGHSVKGHFSATNQDYTWNFDVEYTAKQDITGTCEGEEAEDASYVAPHDDNTASASNLLPEGAVYAVAQVERGSTIEVEEAGYAVVATADVVTAKRVNPGDHLDASTTSSVMFDNGTGMLVKVVEKVAPLTALVGLVPLLDQGHSHPLPLNNGDVTTFIGSDKPFTTSAISVDNVNQTPTTTHAVVLTHDGAKVGEISTFRGIKTQPNSAIEVRTLDKGGAIVQQQKLTGGVLDGTPKVTFNKSVYKAGEKGQLQIANQENYKKMTETTRFSATGHVADKYISLVPLTDDVKGLPSTTPFQTHTLNFETTHAGQARVAVYMPMSVPPKKKLEGAAASDNAVLQQSNDTFSEWLHGVGATE